MLLMPYSSSWFEDLRGVLAYKSISGDFVATTHLNLYSRHGSADPISNPTNEPPNRLFSLAGILARNPTSVMQGAPLPYSNAMQAIGSGGSDWEPNSENYIFLAYGAANNRNTWQYEVKTTLNGNSTQYHLSRGVPNNGEIWLQMVRVGNTFMVLRKHPGGQWIIENRYVRPDFNNAIQVGFTTYTDWDRIGAFNNPEANSFHHNYIVVDDAAAQPDLVAQADYIRFERPNANLTEALLQAAAVDQSAGDVPISTTALTLLSNSNIGAYLGDNANTGPDEELNDNGICFPIGKSRGQPALKSRGQPA